MSPRRFAIWRQREDRGRRPLLEDDHRLIEAPKRGPRRRSRFRSSHRRSAGADRQLRELAWRLEESAPVHGGSTAPSRSFDAPSAISWPPLRPVRVPVEVERRGLIAVGRGRDLRWGDGDAGGEDDVHELDVGPPTGRDVDRSTLGDDRPADSGDQPTNRLIGC